jgi:ABC-type uncharacterized transport system substrate-binding protein
MSIFAKRPARRSGAPGARTWFLAGLALIGATAAAWAHPHVFVTTKTELVFGDGGKVVAIRHQWTFDDMYSAFVTEGLSTGDTLATKEQLAPLAKTNVTQLTEYDWFTVAKVASRKLEFGEPTDYSLEETPDKLVTLRFTLPLKEPASAKKAFTLQIYDPTYFVDFEPSDKEPITLVSAPAGCSSNQFKPGPLAPTDSAKLTESYFTNLSPGADFGIKLASRTIIACP